MQEKLEKLVDKFWVGVGKVSGFAAHCSRGLRQTVFAPTKLRSEVWEGYSKPEDHVQNDLISVGTVRGPSFASCEPLKAEGEEPTVRDFLFIGSLFAILASGYVLYPYAVAYLG